MRDTNIMERAGIMKKLRERCERTEEELCLVTTAFIAARRFIESHAADPDLTNEMIENYHHYLNAVDGLKDYPHLLEESA